VFGPAGYWLMIAGVFVGFWDTVLSDQDGHGRLFGNGLRQLSRRLSDRLSEAALKRVVVLVLVTAAPIALYLAMGQPVGLLKIAGGIEAAHIPVLTALVLFLNRSRLPRDLAPSLPVVVLTAFSGLFFAIFAILYVSGL
ncbi:MAG TPA: hypothetical protein VEC60_04255, partial [Reyranella sp.]|nr:hypothetical protein [Reyranella sp.]